MKIEAGGIYESSCGCVSLIKSECVQEILHSCGAHKLGHEGSYYRRLTIDAAHPIQASDVGRWVLGLLSGNIQQVTQAGVGRGKDCQNVFRWLSRAECKARGLDAQHPTQRDEPARKPGEFRVGDRVRLKLDRAHDEYGPGVVVTHEEWYEARGWRLDEDSLPIRHDTVVGGYRHFWSRAAFLILIEPARGGEDATRKDAEPPDGGPENSPPVARRVSPAELWTPDELGRYARAMWAGKAAPSVLTPEQRYRLALSILCPGCGEER